VHERVLGVERTVSLGSASQLQAPFVKSSSTGQRFKSMAAALINRLVQRPPPPRWHRRVVSASFARQTGPVAEPSAHPDPPPALPDGADSSRIPPSGRRAGGVGGVELPGDVVQPAVFLHEPVHFIGGIHLQ